MLLYGKPTVTNNLHMKEDALSADQKTCGGLGLCFDMSNYFQIKNSFFFQKVHIYKYNGCPKTMSSTDGVDLDGDRNHCPRLRHRHSPYSPADREVIVHVVYN